MFLCRKVVQSVQELFIGREILYVKMPVKMKDWHVGVIVESICWTYWLFK